MKPILAALLLVTAAYSQQVTGTITGAVTDTSGAAVAGVEVRLSNTQTGLSRGAKSDEEGGFRFLVLQPGIYSLDASQAGFKAVRRDRIVVEADRSIAVPVRLEVGAVTEQFNNVHIAPVRIGECFSDVFYADILQHAQVLDENVSFRCIF